ncbi:hypothetical protein J4221_06340 [Candidatus Pacearchaeota archaeon]|nr:hypothetical protein [Candidatus Pacearchaeota archaeon]
MKKRGKVNTNKINNTLIIIGIISLLIIFLGYSSITGKGVFSFKGKGGPSSQCNDHLDNDGDGKCDFLWNKAYCTDGSIPGDSDCISKDDNDERGSCVPVCNNNTDCGTNSYTGDSYCGNDGNVYRDYISYTCENAGKCTSNCNQLTSSLLWENCNGNGCSNGVCLSNGTSSSCTDVDTDGFDSCSPGESGDDGKIKDCNDGDPNTYPNALEICDSKDNDCDGSVDEGLTCTPDNNTTNDNCIIQITDDSVNQMNPAIYGDKIVWEDYTNSSDPNIFLYDLSTKTKKQITINPSRQTKPAIYGDKIVWIDERNKQPDIYMYDLSTNTEKLITNNPYYQLDPAIYDNKIVWEDKRNISDDIFMFDLSTNTERRITDNIYSQGDPAIYGDKIVWEDSRGGLETGYDIYMFDLSTNNEILIINAPMTQKRTDIYGDKIVYEDTRNGNFDIYLYDLATNSEKRITDNPYGQWAAKIYGDKIVYNDIRNSNNDIYMFDLSTNTEKRVTDSQINEVEPDIYENRIVFRSWRNRHGEIFIYDMSIPGCAL